MSNRRTQASHAKLIRVKHCRALGCWRDGYAFNVSRTAHPHSESQIHANVNMYTEEPSFHSILVRRKAKKKREERQKKKNKAKKQGGEATEL